MIIRKKNKMSKFFYVFLLFALSACSVMGIEQVGDVPDAFRINAIKVEEHTKDDVLRLLGSPTSITLFEKETWLYIESKEQKRVFLPSKEIERNVVQVVFKADGTVEQLKQLSLSDGNKIALDETTTRVSGKDLSIIDELVGNFGRFPANKKADR